MLKVSQSARRTQRSLICLVFYGENQANSSVPQSGTKQSGPFRVGNGDSIKLVSDLGVMNGFPRERDSNVIRFPFSLVRKSGQEALCSLWARAIAGERPPAFSASAR